MKDKMDFNPFNDQNDQKNRNDSPQRMPNMNGRGFWKILIVIIIAAFLIPALWSMFAGNTNRPSITYTEFHQQLQKGNIRQVVFNGQEVQGTFKSPTQITTQGNQTSTLGFVTYVPPVGDNQLLPLLEQKGVEISTKPPQDFSILSVILNVVPFIIFIWIGYVIFQNMRAQRQNIFSVGQSRAKLYKRDDKRVTFTDVAGLQGAKEEVKEIIDYLKDPTKYHKLGATTPRGILLVGPPGTGKTLLARAIAGEADVPFYSISGSDFMEMFVGVGASRVRNLFQEAKKHAPALIFIDELDSVGRHRGAGLGGGHDEREQTLNQMLSEMDGFEQFDTTIVIAATNRPDILDPALLRPGRFDRRITVGLPTLEDRVEILAVHARKKPFDANFDMREVAKSTVGFSGADLRNLLNEAALLAARKDKSSIDFKDVNTARDKILMGLERRNLNLTDEEKRLVSYHESGHAVTACLLETTDPLHKVSIIPRDFSMGVTQQMPDRDRFLYSQQYIEERIAVMMGGRAAENLLLGSVTSGSENDLKEATKLARKMVLDWGMSEKLGHIALGAEQQDIFLGEQLGRARDYADETARDIDTEIRIILDRGYDTAFNLLKENRDRLMAVAEALLSREELLGTEVLEILGVNAAV